MDFLLKFRKGILILTKCGYNLKQILILTEKNIFLQNLKQTKILSWSMSRIELIVIVELLSSLRLPELSSSPKCWITPDNNSMGV